MQESSCCPQIGSVTAICRWRCKAQRPEVALAHHTAAGWFLPHHNLIGTIRQKISGFGGLSPTASSPSVITILGQGTHLLLTPEGVASWLRPVWSPIYKSEAGTVSQQAAMLRKRVKGPEFPSLPWIFLCDTETLREHSGVPSHAGSCTSVSWAVEMSL